MPAVLQLLQIGQEQASKSDLRDEEAAAAHDRDFARLVSIVAPALSDNELLKRLWRSIDVTGIGNHSNWFATFVEAVEDDSVMMTMIRML